MTLGVYLQTAAAAAPVMRRALPRNSSPMSFMARVPYALALLTTSTGLLLLMLGGGAAGQPVHRRGVGLAARDDPDASVNLALNFTQVCAAHHNPLVSLLLLLHHRRLHRLRLPPVMGSDSPGRGGGSGTSGRTSGGSDGDDDELE
jgi:hypothetical protein